MEEKKIDVEKMLNMHFHPSWHKVMRKFVESEDFYKIMKFLTDENKAGRKSLPEKQYLFRAFKETKLEDFKVLFLALSPYPQLGVGDGLCFSNSLTKEESPSLKIILDACENDLGYKDERNRDLKRWANQGVLMLNIALTCQVGLPKSHLDIWKPFILYLYKEVFNTLNLKIVYFGGDAKVYQEYENKILQRSLAVEHPSYSARQERPMIHKNLFSFVNNELEKEGKTKVQWQTFGDLPWKEEEPKKQEQEEFI